MFAIRTPTAIVTDLGTEFGIEVSEEGYTMSHVFRGSIRVQYVAARGRREEVVLGENQTARVEKGADADGLRLVSLDATDSPPKFVRRLYEPPKVLDLLDIVAGGDGTGSRRERGINPVNGEIDAVFQPLPYLGDNRYRPVPHLPFIDGVFVPNGAAGSVQLDSAGHVFNGLPRTNGKTWGSVWARAAEVEPDEREKDPHYENYWVYALGRGEQFMPQSRGLLGLHSNLGITFDLSAIRSRHPRVVPVRFRAVAGVADATHLLPTVDAPADIWVFVDGKPKLQRTALRPKDGVLNVDVKLGPEDRFLTLVATDAGDGDRCDWVVFGDPVLEIESIE